MSTAKRKSNAGRVKAYGHQLKKTSGKTARATTTGLTPKQRKRLGSKSSGMWKGI